MNKIERMLQELCPNGVEYKKLGEVCEIKIGEFVHQKLQNPQSSYPVFNGGTSNTGFYDKYNNEGENIIISARGANAGFVNKYVGKYWGGNSCYSVSIIRKNMLNYLFVFYYLKSIQEKLINRQQKGGIPAVSKKQILNIEIPVPPLPIQEEIVRILDHFTELAASLQAELQARKEQYEYYRNKLLTFDNIEGVGTQSVTWMKMSEIGTFIRGNGLQKKDFTETGFPCIHYGQIHTYYGTFASTTKSFTSYSLAERLRKASYGDLIIATTSEDVEGVCKACAWLGKGDVAISGDAYIYKHNQDPKYMSYLFQTKLFLEYKKKAATGTKVVRVSGESMEKFKLPIPPLSEQQRIVSILDKFETLVNDLSQGLPAEIAAVQEQYEYYRNKLLTFKRIA